MPTYEYRCSKCGHELEQFQSITAAPLRVCPHCKARALQRLIGAGGGIIFKGSGFYATDYRSDSYRKAAAADKKPAETTASDKPAKDATPKSPASPTASSSPEKHRKKPAGGKEK